MLCSKCGYDVSGKLYCENCGAKVGTMKQKAYKTPVNNYAREIKKLERRTKLLSILTIFKSQR